MSDTTGIQWCDATFNPWWGCERVSPACAHCYADTYSRRFSKGLWTKAGGDHAFRFFGDKHWNEPLRWDNLAGEGRLPNRKENADGHRPRVFCASMADVFEEHPLLDEPRERLFRLIEGTPDLDWLVLTKRPEFAAAWLERFYAGPDMLEEEVPFANVWLGVSIENAAYTWRADVLRSAPAAVRFLSVEPLLGSLYPRSRTVLRAARVDVARQPRANLDLHGIDWVIVGGESGPGARPFHVQHAREVIVHARLARGDLHQRTPASRGPAIFMKQLGARPVLGKRISSDEYLELELRDRKGGDIDEWPADLRVREFPPAVVR